MARKAKELTEVPQNRPSKIRVSATKQIEPYRMVEEGPEQVGYTPGSMGKVADGWLQETQKKKKKKLKTPAKPQQSTTQPPPSRQNGP